MKPLDLALITLLHAYHTGGQRQAPADKVAKLLRLDRRGLATHLKFVSRDIGMSTTIEKGQIRWSAAPRGWTRQRLYVRLPVDEMLHAPSATAARLLCMAKGLGVRRARDGRKVGDEFVHFDGDDPSTWGGNCVALRPGLKAMQWSLQDAARMLGLGDVGQVESAVAEASEYARGRVRFHDVEFVNDGFRLALYGQRAQEHEGYCHTDWSAGWLADGKRRLRETEIRDGTFAGIELTVEGLRARKVSSYAVAAYGIGADHMDFRRLWLAAVADMVTGGLRDAPPNLPVSGTILAQLIRQHGATAAYERFVLAVAEASSLSEADHQPLICAVSPARGGAMEAARIGRLESAGGDTRHSKWAFEPGSGRILSRAEWRFHLGTVLNYLREHQAGDAEIADTIRRTQVAYRVGQPHRVPVNDDDLALSLRQGHEGDQAA